MHPLLLRFLAHDKPGDESVPALALAQALDGLQRLVHLVAMRYEGKTPGRRIRPSADIQSRYRLVCELPRAGSYISPVRLDTGVDLLSEEDVAKVGQEVDRVLETVGAVDDSAFSAAVPDETWQRFYLEAIERMTPAASAGVEMMIARGDRELLASSRARPFIERLVRGPTRRKARGAVLGQLKGIDFTRRQITIRHFSTDRDLSGVYEAHVEESLLLHPRDMLVVFGTVTRDAEGRPHAIDEVGHVEAVDIEPMPVAPFTIENCRVEPRKLAAATVTFDEEDELFVADIETLGVTVYAESREMLGAALSDELAVLWKHYAIANDAMLTPAARRLKARVHDLFQMTPDAA